MHFNIGLLDVQDEVTAVKRYCVLKSEKQSYEILCIRMVVVCYVINLAWLKKPMKFSLLPHHHIVCLKRSVVFLKRVLHRVQSSASSFNFQYLLFSLRSSSSCLRLPAHSICPSITYFGRQFLYKM